MKEREIVIKSTGTGFSERTDLFPSIPSAHRPQFGEGDKFKAKRGQKKGYFQRPGGGPAGETCNTCVHARRVQGGGRHFWKCWLARLTWTHGPGSDILLKSPACAAWEVKQSAGE